jgi:hypothetical protein
MQDNALYVKGFTHVRNYYVHVSFLILIGFLSQGLTMYVAKAEPGTHNPPISTSWACIIIIIIKRNTLLLQGYYK